MTEWVKACSIKDVPKGEMYSFDYKDKKIMLTNVEGEIYATDRICTHAYAELTNGFLNEDQVTCPLHLSAFDLKTGEPQNPPAEEALKKYNVKIEQNEIYVEV